MPSIQVAPSTEYIPVTHDPRRQRGRVVAGLVYLAVSLSVGVWYLSLLAPSLANDLWWAGFTPTGCEALLIDVINARLATAGTGALHLYGANATSPKMYNLTRATTNVLPTYARTILFSELTSIEYAVRQLRTLSASWSMRMNVQHCWIDFGQSFEVALTEARQQRCRERYASNAAVYMEAILRNVVWADYMTIWGGDNGPFTVAVQLALEESSHGRAFLKAVSIARDTTTCDDELKYWQTFGLVSFQLQWHNRWQSSIHETIILENAIGMQQVLSLKNLPQRAGPWTSSALFWLPLNSLWSPQFVNRSLVRGSSRFFGANASADMPAIDIEVLGGVTFVSGQFENQLEIFRRVIGPFQSVDCLFLQAPSTLQALALYMCPSHASGLCHQRL